MEPAASGPNCSVTAPAACAALALTFLQTGDAAVCEALAPPRTLPALRALSPELVRLRAVARAMVAWHAVEPSEAWLAAQLPPFFKVRTAPPDLTSDQSTSEKDTAGHGAASSMWLAEPCSARQGRLLAHEQPSRRRLPRDCRVAVLWARRAKTWRPSSAASPARV